MTAETIRVAVSGAAGRMGREVVRAVLEADGLALVAAVDHNEFGRDAGEVAGCGAAGVTIETDLESALQRSKPDVLVDFTLPGGVMANIRTAMKLGVSAVVGTTGLSQKDLIEADDVAREAGRGVFLAPNFAIGAVLQMEFAARAAAFMPDVEIIELHHEKKIDSPSGTALLTADRIGAARKAAGVERLEPPNGAVEKEPGARGATHADVPIHSVRLPGFVAHQEVIFGAAGQILTIRHDSTDRRSFMPGVILAVRRVSSFRGLVIGLEKLLD